MKLKLLLFSLIFCLAEANAQFCFNPKTAYPVGIYPSSLCTADFNGDSITDLAVANRTGSVSILLGNSAGGFDTATYFPVGYLPYSICTADFNNDSIADLATANRGPWDVSVIFGNGTGGFGTDSTIGVSNPRAMVSADFNKDGNADLAVAHYGAIMIVLGNGAGGFGAPVSISVSSGISALTTADFNGDTIPDLATANGGSSNVSILLGNGAGGFGAAVNFMVDTGPVAIINADFNHDGKTDLATANMKNNNTGNVSILLGNGNGSFGTATNFPIGANTVPQAFCSADFDGDNKPDLAIAAVANNSTPNVSVLKGNGAGGFGTAEVFAVDSFPEAVISADFNSDGKIDLALVSVFTNNDTGYVDVLLNCNTTGINNVDGNVNQVLVYPNPSNGIFNTQINAEAEGIACMEIFNVLDERIYSASNIHIPTIRAIDLSKKSAGVYFAKIQIGEKTFTRKIVLQ